MPVVMRYATAAYRWPSSNNDSSLGTLVSDRRRSRNIGKLVRSFVSLTQSHERLVSIWLREQRSLAERYRREHDRRQRRITERWIGCLRLCYPGRSTDEIITATRGVQLLLLSEALRPPGGRSAKHAEELLVQLGLSALAALEPAVAATRR